MTDLSDSAGIPGDTATRRRATFHALEVAEVRPLTEDAIEVAFAVPPELEDAYSYAPGQYVALRTTLEGDQLRRSYSICQAPRPAMREKGQPGVLKVAIKRELGGVFSTWAVAELAPGMTLDVMSPEGKFTPHVVADRPDRPARYVGVAAGSGITPMMAVIAHTLRERPDDAFDLVYSNRTAMDAMFVDELADLKDRWTARLGIHHVLTRERRSADLMSGRLDAGRLRRIFEDVIGGDGQGVGSVDEWFLCGPFELVQTCRDLLSSLGVDPRAVRYELFTTDRPERPSGQHGADVPAVSPDRALAPGGSAHRASGEGSGRGEVHRISFRLDGVTSTVTSPVHSRETVLNAALRVRGDVPFACAGGVCGTCRAKLVRGEVDMEDNYALEPDEVAAGFVLTCQSVPTTSEVEVDYDT